jgi:hypothetical protein
VCPFLNIYSVNYSVNSEANDIKNGSFVKTGSGSVSLSQLPSGVESGSSVQNYNHVTNYDTKGNFFNSLQNLWLYTNANASEVPHAYQGYQGLKHQDLKHDKGNSVFYIQKVHIYKRFEHGCGSIRAILAELEAFQNLSGLMGISTRSCRAGGDTILGKGKGKGIGYSFKSVKSVKSVKMSFVLPSDERFPYFNLKSVKQV